MNTLIQTMIQNDIEFYGDTAYPSKTIIFLISGHAGVGKTTFGDSLLYYCNSVQLDCLFTHFAEGVKRIARQMGWDNNKDEKGRNLLQKIGGIGREYNQDTWVNYLYDFVIPEYEDQNLCVPDIIIIDDWRYPNEYETINNKFINSTIYRIRIVAPSREILKNTIYYNDSSETSLDDYTDYDFIINNEDDLTCLEKQAYNVIYKVFDGRI